MLATVVDACLGLVAIKCIGLDKLATTRKEEP